MRLSLFLLFFLALPAQRAISQNIVVVNFQTVFEEYSELQRLDREFRQEADAFQEQQQQAVQELQAKQQEFAQLRQKAAQPDTEDEEREQLAEEAGVLLEELNNEEQRLRTNLQEFQKELEAKGIRLRRRIVNDVRNQIEGFAKSQRWDLVVDSSATGPNGLPVVQYANPELDKTRWVITELNQAAARNAGEE